MIFERFRPGGSATVIGHDAMSAVVSAGDHLILDVRERKEYAAGHIPGALNLPLSSLDPEQVPRDRPVVVYCLSGARSAMAARMLAGAGVPDVQDYRPGFGIWRMQGGAIA